MFCIIFFSSGLKVLSLARLRSYSVVMMDGCPNALWIFRKSFLGVKYVCRILGSPIVG